MKKLKVFNLLSLIFNLIIVGLTIFVGVVLVGSKINECLLFFTVLSNFLMGLAALLVVIFDIAGLVGHKPLPKGVAVFKLVATISVTITFLTVVAFLAPTNGFNYAAQFGEFDLMRIELHFHLIVPVLSMITYLFFDKSAPTKWVVNFFSIVPVFLYGIFYLLNNTLLNIQSETLGTCDWYGFFKLGGLGGAAGIFVGILVVGFFVSLLFWLINKKVSASCFVYAKPEESKEEPAVEPAEEEPAPVEEPVQEESTYEPEPAKEESKKEEKKPVVKKAPAKKAESEKAKAPAKKAPAKKEEPKAESKKQAASKSNPSKDGTKVYHLTKRKEDDMWAITFVGGQKAVKLFKTKKEAEEALEVLTKNQGATALIRNSKGAKAGKFASSIKSKEE